MEICFPRFDPSGKYTPCCPDLKLYHYYMDIQKACSSNFKSKVNMVYTNKKNHFKDRVYYLEKNMFKKHSPLYIKDIQYKIHMTRFSFA